MSFISDALSSGATSLNLLIPGLGTAVSPLIGGITAQWDIGKSSGTGAAAPYAPPTPPAPVLIENPAWTSWNALYGSTAKAARFGGAAPPPAPERYINAPSGSGAADNHFAAVDASVVPNSLLNAGTGISAQIESITGGKVQMSSTGGLFTGVLVLSAVGYWVRGYLKKKKMI